MSDLVLTWDAFVNAVGAAASIALGIWVLTLSSRTRSMRFFAALAIAVGCIYVPQNLVRWSDFARFAFWSPYVGVLATIGGLAILGLIHEFLRSSGSRGRRLWSLALGISAAMTFARRTVTALGLLFGQTGPPQEAGGLQGWQLVTGLVAELSIDFLFGTFLAWAVVLALLYRTPSAPRETTRTRLVMMSSALVLWPAAIAGTNAVALTAASSAADRWAMGLSFLGFLGLATLWLTNSHSVDHRSGEGRNMTLLILVMMLLGMIQFVFVMPHFGLPTGGPFWGLVRLVAVFGLAYGILQHQVLGIDAKFRWGVSRTTIAAVFIAVFFIVSEGAQELFAGVVGSQYLGILAAGALVFVLAPLQRMADALAEKAVPSSETYVHEGESSFAAAVRMAMADGTIGRAEERQLARLMEDVGLAPTRAVEIRERIEAELCGGASEGASARE